MKNLFARLFGGSPSFASITADLDNIRAKLHAHHAAKREQALEHGEAAKAAHEKAEAAHDEADRALQVAGNLGKLLGA